MPVIQSLVNSITDNLDFYRNKLFVFLINYSNEYAEKNKSKASKEKAKDSEDEEDDEEEEDGEEGDEDEAKPDYSKFDSIIANAEKLYISRNFGELENLLSENPDAANIPKAQKYRLMLELQNKKPNVNSVKNYASVALEENPNSQEGNYGMAYYYFYNKRKPDKAKAREHIKKAIEGRNPLKEALELSKQMESNSLIWIILLIVALALVGGVFAFIKFKKRKQVENNNENLEIIEETTNETDNENIVSDDNSSDLISNSTIDENYNDSNKEIEQENIFDDVDLSNLIKQGQDVLNDSKIEETGIDYEDNVISNQDYEINLIENDYVKNIEKEPEIENSINSNESVFADTDTNLESELIINDNNLHKIEETKAFESYEENQIIEEEVVEEVIEEEIIEEIIEEEEEEQVIEEIIEEEIIEEIIEEEV